MLRDSILGPAAELTGQSNSQEHRLQNITRTIEGLEWQVMSFEYAPPLRLVFQNT